MALSLLYYPDAVQVSIVNDGPTILGASTTYHATINNVPPDVTAFVCSWTEWKCGRLIPDFSQTNVTDNKCQLSSIYDCSEDVGLHPVFLVVLNDNLKAIGDELSDVTITGNSMHCSIFTCFYQIPKCFLSY